MVCVIQEFFLVYLEQLGTYIITKTHDLCIHIRIYRLHPYNLLTIYQNT